MTTRPPTPSSHSSYPHAAPLLTAPTRDGIRIVPMGDVTPHVRIVDRPPLSAALQVEVERIWLRECRANPRLHNGPVLNAIACDPASGLITCAIDCYQNLVAAQCGIPTGTRMLGVQGVLMTSVPDCRLLVGRRGAQTRMYPGLDEFAPSGGVRPPKNAAARAMSDHDLHAELLNEAQEELASTGIDVASLTNLPARVLGLFEDEAACCLFIVTRLDLAAKHPSGIQAAHNPTPARVLGLCEDDTACSLDIVVPLGLTAAPGSDTQAESDHAWEYAGTRWLNLRTLHDEIARTPARFSPNTRQIALQLLPRRN